MTALFRSTLLFALFALALTTGCPSDKPKPDGGPTDSGSGCYADSDCPDPQLFFCNSATSMCEPSCRTKGDCSAATRGQYALDYCNGTLGCQCDEGRCVAGLCGSDADCGSSVCRDGACVPAPAATTVAKCAVIPDFVAMKKGDTAHFNVSTWDSSGKPVVLKDGVTWSAATATVTLGTMSASAADFTAAATVAQPEQAVKASVNGHDCFAQVLVLDDTVAAGTVSVLVTDELTGRPISGVTILASDVATGAALGATAMTNASGFANLTPTGGPTSVDVSAFHADYGYLTIANYAMTGSRFLSMPLRRNPVDNYGGFKGTMTNVPATSNVHAGIAAMSLPGSITDLNISQLLGPSQSTHIKIGTAVDTTADVPAGVYLGFADQQIKTNVSGQGLAGVCVTSSGAPDEANIAAGKCGTRAAWGLVGDVPLGDLPISAFTGGLTNINYGDLLSHIIPIFKKFNSSMSRDVQFTLKTTPKTNGSYDFSDVSSFTSQDLDFSQTPLAFNFVAQVPDLPQFRGNYVDGVVVLGGADVVGRGVVPMGLGVAVNTMPQDNKTDTQSGLSSPGLMSIRMAPTHAGAEGSEYGLVALAVSLKGLSDTSVGLAASGLFPRIPGNKLVFDPTGTAGGKVDLGSSGGFPAFPDTARFNYSDAAQGALNPRTFKFATAPSLTDMSVVRVVFTDGDQHRWSVLSDAASPGFTLPAAPATFGDRTRDNGMATGARSTLLVQTVRLNDDPAGGGNKLGYGALVEQNSTNSDRLNHFTTAFSLIDYGAPSISWKTPSADGAVTHGTNVTVAVKNFKVGSTASDDGYVHLSFNGGTGCTPVDVNTDASMGKGEITLTIPTGCTSAGAIPVTAELYSTTTSAAIDPPVAATLNLTIN